MSQTLGVSNVTVLRHLQNIRKVIKLNIWITRELIEHWKFEVCSMLCLRNINDPFHNQIVTCYKKLIFYDNRKQSD